MKITFLGPGEMQPTKERNLSSIYFSYEAENILFDCGEGTQRQMKFKELKANKLTRIFISHFHADHVLGLGGILRTLEANEYKETLFIYGPAGLQKFYNNLVNSAYGGKGIKVKLIELKTGKIFDSKKFFINCSKLDHSVPSYSFSIIEKDKRKMNLEYLSKFGLTKHPLLGKLQEGKNITYEGKKITAKKATKIVKGRKLTIIADTGYTENAVKLAKDSDLIISERTFGPIRVSIFFNSCIFWFSGLSSASVWAILS